MKMFKPIEEIALLLFSICPLIINFQTVSGYAIDKSATHEQSVQLHEQRLHSTTTTNSSPPSSSSMTSKPSALDNKEATVHVRFDNRRPVWNLAHMVNSIKELDYRLGKGANAVEVDVTFGRDGDPLFTYHGPPCDCWRHCHQQEDFNEYLSYVREIAIDQHQDGIGKNLSLLFLDLKLDYLDHNAKARAGSELARSIVTHLFPQPPLVDDAAAKQNKSEKNLLRLILSVNHVTDIELVHNFLHYMDTHNASHLMGSIGFDVGMNDDLHLIESMWRKFGNTLNIWQGDGYTNCFSPFYNLERLSKAIQKRDNESGYPRKVYQWTIDLHDRMREALLMGVDAVMTNHPERLLSVLREPDVVHNFRLATRDDDPFKKVIHRAKSSESARYQRSASPSNGGFFGSLVDVLASWFTYIKEIPFFSLPTTSRWLAPAKANRRQQKPPTTTNDNNAKAISMAGQPEYRVDGQPHNITQRAATNTAVGGGANTTLANADGAESHSSSTITDTLDKTLLNQNDNEPPPYEGPKWYTSLLGNLLVSAMKIILPT